MDWNFKKLSDVCTQIFAGGDVPKDRLSKYQTEDYQIPIFSNGEKNKGLYGYTDVARVHEPSITVSARGTIGYSEIRYDPFLPVVRLIVLTPNTKIVTLEFLRYAIKGLEFVNSGSSIPQLTVPMIKDYEFTLPPIPVQYRIVAILDQAFADIEKARANAEQNLKNARELFDSYLQQVFSQRGEGWVETNLATIAENLDSKRVPITKSNRTQGKYPYYGASGIVDYVSDYIFDELLLLISEDGANLLARTYPIAFGASGKYWVNNHAHVLRFKNDKEQKFIEYYLNSISLEPFVSGMAQPKLNQKSLNKIPVPMPNASIVKIVIRKLDALSSEVKRLDAIYNSKLAALDELKKTILQKAFSGELTKSKGIAA